jgi:hypothetical protein
MEDLKQTTSLEEIEERQRLIATYLPCRFIKLNNGEDVIAQVILSVDIPDTHMLRFPFRVLSDDEFGPSRFALIPLIPFTDQEVVPISKACVVSIVSVREEIQRIYAQRVLDYVEQMASGSPAFEPLDEEEPDDHEGDEFKKPKGGPGGWVN